MYLRYNPSIYLFIYLSIYLFIYIYIHRYRCMYIYIYICIISGIYIPAIFLRRGRIPKPASLKPCPGIEVATHRLVWTPRLWDGDICEGRWTWALLVAVHGMGFISSCTWIPLMKLIVMKQIVHISIYSTYIHVGFISMFVQVNLYPAEHIAVEVNFFTPAFLVLTSVHSYMMSHGVGFRWFHRLIGESSEDHTSWFTWDDPSTLKYFIIYCRPWYIYIYTWYIIYMIYYSQEITTPLPPYVQHR